VTKNGSGQWTLSGANTYSGGTTISAGTLQLGNGGTSGSIVGDVVNNGIFAVNRSDTFTFGGVISGAGAFGQLGTGTTVLTGASSYTGGTTISAGTLQLGNGGTSGRQCRHGQLWRNTRRRRHGFGGVTIADGGILAPGHSPGTHLGSLSLATRHAQIRAGNASVIARE
jgi:fibronectin-binding autotransporter adhesin